MKKSELRVGKTYIGKTGKRRKLEQRGLCTSYINQKDRDCVCYHDLDGFGGRQFITAASFAKWAKKESEE